ncbi:MAG TPA: efflux RND transporter periplasmic adaptor subunit [Bryobacteraceae bacterium]|jgi:RND family efflux transporter MFP subunit
MKSSRRTLYSILTISAVALLAIVGFGLWPRIMKQRTMLADVKEESEKLPAVRVTKVAYMTGATEIDLPADLQAEIETPVNARVEGYIVKRTVDIGWRVKKGQLLAELETPELDQQILQAKASISQGLAAVKQQEAQLLQTKANLKLAEVTAGRWKKLTEEGVTSVQDTDEKVAAFEVRKAELAADEANISAANQNVAAAQANLHRLDEMKSFSKLTAPFDGVITYRNPDIGTLVSAGANQKEVFRVADISKIRIFVNVPQAYVSAVRPGTPAVVHIEDLNKDYRIPVGGITYSLDLTSRTMLAVLRVPNADGPLMPGMFCRVRIMVPNPPTVLAIPADAVVSRNEGQMVALVGSDHRVHYRKVVVARDTGSKVEVTSGVSVGDRLVLNPTDEIREGTVVDIGDEDKPPAAAAAPRKKG